MNQQTIAIYLREGNKFKRQGELEKAIASYKRVLELNPNSAWSYHNLGEVLAKQGQIEEAIASYKMAIELNPKSALSHYNLEDLLTQKGLMDEAATSYQMAGDLKQNNEELSQKLPQVLENKNLFESANSEENLDVNLGNSLLAEGKINEAIAYYQKIVEFQTDSGEVWSKLANAYYLNKNWQAAIDSSRQTIALMPDNYECYKILGWCLKKTRQMDEAIAAYSKVIELNPDDSEAYYWLGDIFRLKGNVEEAIAIYQQGLEKLPGEVELKTRLEQLMGEEKALTISEYYQQGMEWSEQNQLEKAILCYEKVLANLPLAAANEAEKYLSLGVALVKLGKLEEIIDCYHRVFQKSVSNLEFYSQFSVCLSARELMAEAVKFFQEIPKSQPQEKGSDRWEVYDLIWDLCNLQDSSNLDVEISQNQPIDPAAAYQYFCQYKPYQILVSSRLNESEKSTLKDFCISLEYLKLLEKEDRELENIYINSYRQASSDIIKRKAIVTKRKDSYYKPKEFQQTIVECKYMYAVCPLSGSIVRSNHSFYIPGGNTIVYRFIGREIFYLVVGGFTGEKVSVYFPKFNLNIYLPNTGFVNSWVKNETIHWLQSYMVSNWKYVKNYLASTTEKAVVAVVGVTSNLGHYFWQDITGIYYVLENNLLDKIDYFCVGKDEYLSLSSIFPEIPHQKIVKISEISREEQFTFFIENNYVCLRIADNFIKQSLAERIYQTARYLCSQEFLESVIKAKENCQLLLWINIRTHNKSWTSQVKGYSLIVNNLRKNFPKLSIGVVIDGTPDAASCAQDIISKLNPKVKVYNTLGCPLAESIVWAHYIDVYIATIGSGLVMTSWLSNKPGVAHGDRVHLNQELFWSNMKENSIPPVFVKRKHITSQSHRMYGNYQINWRVIYNYLLEILQSHSLV